MKLKIPKVKKIAKVHVSPRLIARMFIKGYTAKKRRPGKEIPEREALLLKYKEKYMGEPGPAPGRPVSEVAAKTPAGGEKKMVVEKAPKKKPLQKGFSLPTGMEYTEFMVPVIKQGLKKLNIKYPLIPAEPKQGEEVLAYAYIAWDENLGSVVYNVIEPKLTPTDIELIDKIKRDIEERLDINFSKLGKVKAREVLNEEIEKALKKTPGADATKIPILRYNIEKEALGLGMIEPLMQDPEIEDISCDGENVPIYVYHRNPKLGSLRTNISFKGKADLDAFVLKLAQRCGKSISIAEPLLDAALPDGSRVQCTMGTDIARRGSNFTIRKFTFYPLTPTHMIHYKTLNSMQLAYLWLAIENGKSVLISGGTATGKTSLLNALSLFIKPDLKILSIEDTPELRLPHTHWVPEVARSPLSVKGKTGEVTLFDLLKSSLRQRPDYLVVGEVRGREAFVMFQQIATGHASLATIHAASLNQLVDRLITPPISLPPALIENIDIMVFLQRVKVKNKYARRTNEILEVIGIENDRPVTTKIFDWHPMRDAFVACGKSKVMEDVARINGLTEESVQADVLRRKKILDWMHERRIFDYNNIGKIVSSYYSHPGRLMAFIEGSSM